MIAFILAVAIVVLALGWILFIDRSKAKKADVNLDELRDRGVNVDGPILWNYLFVHRDYPQLGKFMQHMKRSGYDVAEVNEVDDGETGVIDYELRLQLLEQHTAQSLAQKLNEMRDLAAKWQLDQFDSWYPEGYVEAQPSEVEH